MSNAAPSPRWHRWLLPSFIDMVFISVIVWTFMAGDLGWSTLLVDGDSGWHIRTGQYILQTHSVPHTDLFSFSKAGQPWFAWEWLTDVLYALLFGWFGLKGVVLLCGVVISATAAVLCRHLVWRGASPLVALGMTLLTLGAASIHFHARPHVFTLLFLAIGMWLIDADRRSPGKRIWLLVPLMALWTNLHGGFPVFIAILGLLVIGTAVQSALAGTGWAMVKRYTLLTAACAAVTLVNPYGWGLHQHILEYLRSDWIQSAVQEFQAPNFRGEGMLDYQIMLFIGLLITARLIKERDFPAALWLLFLAHESLTSARHIPLFAIVAAPLLATELSRLWEGWARHQAKQSLGNLFWKLGEDIRPHFLRLSAWSAVWIAVLVTVPALTWPADYPALRFPVKMVQRYGDLLARSRVFTEDQWADYLVYRSYPKQKVFLDGRSDFYGAKLGKEYLNLVQVQHDWRSVLDRYQFDVVLAPADWALATLLKEQPDWQLVADDHKALLFVRRTAPAALIAQVR